MTKAEIEERELRVMRDDALGILHDFKYPDHIYTEGVNTTSLIFSKWARRLQPTVL